MQNPITHIQEYPVYRLDKEMAKNYCNKLLELIGQIPLVSFTESDILADTKGDRVLSGKWEHSFVVFDYEKLIAVIMGYERKAEGNEQFPYNTMYISKLAVAPEYQKKRVAKQLIELFLQEGKKSGFLYLKEKNLRFSVQTNSAGWNMHVQQLYEFFGFKKTATKIYDNRVDFVFTLVPSV